jgi:hypothetical protein
MCYAVGTFFQQAATPQLKYYVKIDRRKHPKNQSIRKIHDPIESCERGLR